jgi:hypothetical protein
VARGSHFLFDVKWELLILLAYFIIAVVIEILRRRFGPPDIARLLRRDSASARAEAISVVGGVLASFLFLVLANFIALMGEPLGHILRSELVGFALAYTMVVVVAWFIFLRGRRNQAKEAEPKRAIQKGIVNCPHCNTLNRSAGQGLRKCGRCGQRFRTLGGGAVEVVY